MSRRLAREKALQILFQIDVGKIDPQIALQNILSEADLLPHDETFTRQIVQGVLAKIAELDANIRKYIIDWELERLANVDRNLLRMAIYEMSYLADDIPSKVSINEAVELAKSYSSADSGKFINGILDQFKKKLESELQKR